ncbi:MAG: thiamine-phosphate kinase [Candidatus Eisenbacteria bacterium]
MGELTLIEKIRELIGDPGPGTRIGLGDDGAVLEPSSGLTILTCDAFVEGVHFRRDFASLRDVGYKCMVANLSDVAAMGGFPAQAVVSLCVAPGISEADVLDLYAGMLAATRKYGAEIVGGDVVSSPSELVVSVAMLGVVDPGRVVTRRGAVPGDAIVVTGALGGSETGLRALCAGLPVDASTEEVVRRHLAPCPRIAEAQAIIDVATPHAMLDVSDGLSTDLWHMADESAVGLTLRESAVPVLPAAADVADRLGLDPSSVALASGEEFELVVALAASEVERTEEHLSAVTGTRLTRIGEITERGAGCVLVRKDGSTEPLGRSGYEHEIGSGR